MNKTEHKKYLEDISSLTKRILSSEKLTTDFLIRAKINTPSGKLTKIYSENVSSLGYKSK